MEDQLLRDLKVERTLFILLLLLSGLGVHLSLQFVKSAEFLTTKGSVGPSGLFFYLLLMMGALFFQSFRQAQTPLERAEADQAEQSQGGKSGLGRRALVVVDRIFVGGGAIIIVPIFLIIIFAQLSELLSSMLVLLTLIAVLAMPILPFIYLVRARERASEVALPVSLGLLTIMVALILNGLILGMKVHFPQAWWAGSFASIVASGVILVAISTFGLWVDRLSSLGLQRASRVIGAMTLPLIALLILIPSTILKAKKISPPRSTSEPVVVYCATGQKDPAEEFVENTRARVRRVFRR